MIVKKLTHKEKKLLKKQDEYNKMMEVMLKKGGAGSSSIDETFSLTQAQISSKQQELMDTAVDIKVCYNIKSHHMSLCLNYCSILMK